MLLKVFDDKPSLGEAAASQAATAIRSAIVDRGRARVVAASAASQFEFLEALTATPGITWEQVELFHLDEYIGLPDSSPASFRKYLRERFIQQVGPLKEEHWVNGEGDPVDECKRLGEIIRKNAVDLALVGIGENGHLGFNDPPADFQTQDPFIVVDLDEQCRKQQFGEGWFKALSDVPRRAITMSIHQIMKSHLIICSVPERRKAEAVRDCLEKSVSNVHPASILQMHEHCICFLDKSSAVLLRSPEANLKDDHILKV